MIDFSNLTKPKKVIVPIFDNSFQYNLKKYKISSENGWFFVEISGNNTKVIEPCLDFSSLKEIQGFTYNDSIIFQNFDSAKRNWKFGLSCPLNFNNALSFSAIKAVVWEDKKVYYTQPNYSDFKIFEVKNCFDSEENVKDLKGLTPELKTVFLFHFIERDNLRRLEKAKLRAEEEKRLKETIPYRLKESFEKAGAKLLNYSLSGKRIYADWSYEGSSYRYNSVIDRDTFKIIEAGYCMNHDDKRHSITSMVKTAEEYEERHVTHITRHQ